MTPSSTGFIFGVKGVKATFVGSCFALWRADCFVTAAHVTDLAAEGLRIAYRGGVHPWPAAEVVRHPEADLAVVRLREGAPSGTVEPFERIGERPAIGAAVQLYGYTQAARQKATVEGARFSADVVGYTPCGGRYTFTGALLSAADWLSGLSGCPVFEPDGSAVVGLLTNAREQTRPVPGFGSLDGLTVRRVERRNAFAVMLADFAPWLEAAAV